MHTVFYSWQSDLPNAVNRGFIQGALEDAAAQITADDTVDIEPVIDRDTQGIAGSPDIASTIFLKITSADVFVADVSIVSRPDTGRPSPNPNVLLELGYAFKALGQERVILVFNEVFGRLDELPFDLRSRRVLAYNMPVEIENRSPERASLRQKLDAAIRAALSHLPSRDVAEPLIPAVSAINSQQIDRIPILRQNLDALFHELEEKEPRLARDGRTVEELEEALNTTQEVVTKFVKIFSSIAIMSDFDSAKEVIHSMSRIFEKYNLPQGYSGAYNTQDFDYFKFLGNEILVSFVACLIRESRWEIIQRALDEPIEMRYLSDRGGPGVAYWHFASRDAGSLRRQSRVSLHADILHKRHSEGDLGAVVPFDIYSAADLFLFLRGEFENGDGQEPRHIWFPWSILYLDGAPLFMHSAQNEQIALKIIAAMKAPYGSSEAFKPRLIQKLHFMESLFGSRVRRPIDEDVITAIGSRR